MTSLAVELPDSVTEVTAQVSEPETLAVAPGAVQVTGPVPTGGEIPGAASKGSYKTSNSRKTPNRCLHRARGIGRYSFIN